MWTVIASLVDLYSLSAGVFLKHLRFWDSLFAYASRKTSFQYCSSNESKSLAGKWSFFFTRRQGQGKICHCNIAVELLSFLCLAHDDSVFVNQMSHPWSSGKTEYRRTRISTWKSAYRLALNLRGTFKSHFQYVAKQLQEPETFILNES